MFHVLLHVQDEEAMVGISAMYHLHVNNLFRYLLFLSSVDATHDDGRLGIDWSITAAGPPMLKLQ